MSIEKFAIWARKELISRVEQRAYQYGITNKPGFGDVNALSIDGKALSEIERKQRRELINELKNKGYEQVMEEVAYTWFNRFIALRFMEVNNYLPSHIRVFTDINGKFNPEIIKEALNLDFESIDRNRVADLINDSNKEELYRYLLLVQCNELNKALPVMFERMDSYTGLLLPNNILSEDGIIGRMISDIPEEEWTNQVQVIGWLYQYYNTELKDDTFAQLQKNVKISKERIAAATQLFTPDWIVRYMVENSVGRKYIESCIKKLGIVDEKQRIAKEEELAVKMEWKYYLPEAEQKPEVRTELNKTIDTAFNPEKLTVIDPCMGSGHILVYVFDTLIKIYERCGYETRDAVKCILKNNIFGLDIDKRAAQLAYFALMMKARQYDRRILKIDDEQQIQLNIECFQGLDFDSTGIDDGTIKQFIKKFEFAAEYGSLLEVDDFDASKLAYAISSNADNLIISAENNQKTLNRMLQIACMTNRKYDVVITNPPYMGGSGMNATLLEFVKRKYADSKSDLFSCFIEKCRDYTNSNGYYAMITQQSWMFLSSFEKLRTKMATNTTINMAHLGARAFDQIGGEVVQTTAFVNVNNNIEGYNGTYLRLIEANSEKGKSDAFITGNNRYFISQSNFSKIPGSPIAYWLSKSFNNVFEDKKLIEYGRTCQGLATADNNRFLRFWFECSNDNIYYNCENHILSERSDKKWYPCTKGGPYRKWYGNFEYLVNWQYDGAELKRFKAAVLRNTDYYFKEGCTWSTISSNNFSMRYAPIGSIFESKGSKCFINDVEYFYPILGLLNTKVVQRILEVLAPTLDFHEGPVGRIPVKLPKEDLLRLHIESNVKSNIIMAKSDWDAFETSWDFEKHPLVRLKSRNLKNAFSLWMAECDQRFNQLKANEEELNRIFLDIYGLQDELTPEVADKDITVRKADLQRDIKSLISYAVGCMFGRYSLDEDGLAYAGGDWDISKYKTFIPDDDNIIPICDTEYFSDDIVGRFVEWVEKVYGSEDLEGNLAFIAGALGGQGAPRDVIRKYFLNDFYADHCKIYQKRPIYWLFDSGKKNGFKALIYMHRYSRDLLARLRTDYVHEQQERYDTRMAHIEKELEGASAAEASKLKREQTKLKDQAMELHKFEEKVHDLADRNIEIDLDDGVKNNYAIFADVLAKLK